MEHLSYVESSPPARVHGEAGARCRREIEASLANVLDASPDLVGSITLERRPLYLNAAGRRLLGVAPDQEIEDLDVLDFYPPADARRIAEEAFPTALADGCWSGEVILLAADGREVPMHQVILAHAGSGGERLLSTVARDITMQKLAEAELRESEQRFRGTFEQAAMGLAHLGIDGRLLWVNETLCRIFERRRGELLGRPLADVYPALAGGDPLGLARLLAGELERFELEGLLLRRQGGVTSTRLRLSLLRDDDGKARYFVAVVEDVTDRLRARESEQRLGKVLESTPDFVGTMTAGRRAVYLNAAGRALVGIGEGEDMAAIEPFRFHPEWARRLIEKALPAVLAGHTWTGESALLARNGREIPVLQVMFAHRGLDDTELLVTTIARDISELKRVQATIEEAKANAERANRAKSEFLANMSHELRTPLNAVIGFAEMLVDRHYGELGERQGQCLGHILEAGHHLLDLINDILDLAKVEAGRLTLDAVELDAGLLVTDLVEAVRVLAERKRVALAVEVGEGLPRIAADPRRLKQIILNLLSNAVKFTLDGGRIVVSVRPAAARGGPGDAGGIWFAVADSGIGIRAEDQARLFQPFEQIDASYRRSQQGTGLGLALSRRLAELHGGRVWVESAGAGRGSTFHLVLPARLPAAGALPP
jgi:PAS domain S-box-containing protein